MSSHIDATARLAGLTGTESEPLPPSRLIRLYCSEGQGSAWRSEKREHSDWHAGFIGWMGGRYGYDDGYSYMDALMGGGWRALPEVGDWPYKIYLAWPVPWPPPEGAEGVDAQPAIAYYCEGDFGVEVFHDLEQAKAALAQLRKDDPAP